MSQPAEAVSSEITQLTHFVNGEHVAGTSGRYGDVFNPATGEVQRQVPYATAEELNRGLPGAMCAGVVQFILSYNKFVPTDDDYRDTVRSILRRRLNDLINLGDLLNSFRRVVIPELNMGQLSLLIRAKYLVDARPFTKVQGQPFSSQELEEHILGHLQEVQA